MPVIALERTAQNSKTAPELKTRLLANKASRYIIKKWWPNINPCDTLVCVCFILRSYCSHYPFYYAVQVLPCQDQIQSRGDTVMDFPGYQVQIWICFITQQTISKSASYSKSWWKIKYSMCGGGGGKVFHNTIFLPPQQNSVPAYRNTGIKRINLSQ